MSEDDWAFGTDDQGTKGWFPESYWAPASMTNYVGRRPAGFAVQPMDTNGQCCLEGLLLDSEPIDHLVSASSVVSSDAESIGGAAERDPQPGVDFSDC